MIPRYIKNQIYNSLKPGKVVGLFGPRQVGKTVLMEEIKLKLIEKRVLLVQGDNLDVAEILSSQRISILKNFLNGYDYLFVDEAQKISNVGANLKLIADNFKNICTLISGSSALDLRLKTAEPLTGRLISFFLYPIACIELKESFLTAKENLSHRLIYGSYPELVTAHDEHEKTEILNSIKDGYLLKDILTLDNQKDSIFIINLLRLLAFQIGNDISYSELASNLNVNKKTVIRYLDLLEKCFVLFSLHGFSRNMRNEYTKTPRYYFWDNGIRNSLISNFNRPELRDDIGKLWENYCISERMKKNRYNRIQFNPFYWRTYDQKEIDYLEEKEGKLDGYEFKWTERKVSAPKDFLSSYKNSSYRVIHRDNFHDFIG